MARLYPPSIAGALPSFYAVGGTVILTVPFSLNKTVSINQVQCCRARIKRLDTDTLIDTVDSVAANWTTEAENLSLNFTLPSSIVSKLSIGSAYKIQIAYIDTTSEEGYYSTVGIIKYTNAPTVSIVDLSTANNNSNRAYFLGKYVNSDSNEKAEWYKYDLYDKDGFAVESSGWYVHNSYEDTSSIESTNRFILNTYLDSTKAPYILIYTIKTSSGLIVSSPFYNIVSSIENTDSIKGSLITELDYENGCVLIKIAAGADEYVGNFRLKRRTIDNNEITLYEFSTTFHDDNVIFKDTTVESGVSYTYSIERYTDSQLFKSKDASPITPYFEYVFLQDKDRMLRLAFNTSVNSFKSIITEAKKSTLGAKYPYFFRNAYNDYKEFNISGLISYFLDENHTFFKSGEMAYANTTDQTDENFASEKEFKLQVLKWLNNGEVKLFRSPTVGNYLVRLTNVALTPQANTTEMLHTFSCTADEVAAITQNNLIKYGFGYINS